MASSKVQRLVDVLDVVLARNSAGVRLSDIVNDLGSPLSSTHALLKDMAGAGILTVDAGRLYRIGPRFVQLAVSAGRSLDVRVLAHAHLEHLAADLSHDVYLAIRVGDSVTYVDRIPGRGQAAVDIRLGDPIPLHASAAGKLFCAFSPELERRTLTGPLPALTGRTLTTPQDLADELKTIRMQAYSVSHEETITGIVGAAVPVWASPGELLAAVHVSGFRDLIGDEDVPHLIQALQACSAAIAHSMGLGAPVDEPKAAPQPTTPRPR
jgi:DNA-binding IclR family transcriptional regulator